MKILCVDDSKAIHAFLSDCLNRSDLVLSHVYDGKEAVDVLIRKNEKFDLILLDWEMPEMTGPETFEALKASGLNTPVIMLTSKNEPRDMMKMLDAGVYEYVLKPFTRELILEKIQQVNG